MHSYTPAKQTLKPCKMCDRFIDEAEIETLSPLEVSALMSEDLEDLCRLCMGNEKTQGLDMVAISDKYPESNIFISSLFFDVLQINVRIRVT